MMSIRLQARLAGMWLSCSTILLAQTLPITQYTIPTPNGGAGAIVTGPDSALWFAEFNKIGRITTAGVITEFPVPNANGASLAINSIAAGPDGALWFVEVLNNMIGRVTTSGSFTLYTVPTADSDPYGIAPGPDGALWFGEQLGNNIGRITTAGVFTEFPVPTGNANPVELVAGPDGALWFTEQVGDKIGRITTAGVITEYPIPTVTSQPVAITAGPDGALWFVETLGNNIGRITTAGVITEYPVPTAHGLTNPFPQTITAGPDGALWFTEGGAGKIGRITTAGAITEYAAAAPDCITLGPDSALWVTLSPNSIGRFVPPTTLSPVILTGGVLNAASYAVLNGAGAPVAPGSLVAIFTSTLAAQAGSFTGTSLPPSLGGVSVTFNNVTAPMITVAPTGANPYVSAQVPFEVLSSGTTSGNVPVVLTVNGTPSAPVQVSIVPSAPGIYTIPPTGQGNAILVFTNPATNAPAIAAPSSASLGYPTAPIPRGTLGFFYVNGLGAMTPSVPDGSGTCPAATGVCNANAMPTVMVGGVSAQVAFAGQAPGFPGVFQVNITIPEGAPVGSSVPLVVKSADGTVTSNAATIAVQ